MTTKEAEMLMQIFTAFPSLALAIVGAKWYVSRIKQNDAAEDRLLKLEANVEANKQNINLIAGTHLMHHPEDAGKFIKDEFTGRSKNRSNN